MEPHSGGAKRVKQYMYRPRRITRDCRRGCANRLWIRRGLDTSAPLQLHAVATLEMLLLDRF